MPTDDAQDLERLVARLDQDADRLHADMTPAVHELGTRGRRIVPVLKPALESPNEMTRLHAQRALEAMVQRELGFVAGQGWTRPGGEQEFMRLWKANGSYDYVSPESVRNAAVDAWLAWSRTKPAG